MSCRRILGTSRGQNDFVMHASQCRTRQVILLSQAVATDRRFTVVSSCARTQPISERYHEATRRLQKRHKQADSVVSDKCTIDVGRPPVPAGGHARCSVVSHRASIIRADHEPTSIGLGSKTVPSNACNDCQCVSMSAANSPRVMPATSFGTATFMALIEQPKGPKLIVVPMVKS